MKFPSSHQDLLTPFMCSDRWPDDTLFFVFEEDMEFFPQGIIPGRSDEAVSSIKASSYKIPAGMGSIFCSDLVKIATQAHRIGKGELFGLATSHGATSPVRSQSLGLAWASAPKAS